jgi:uncharacterized membrane protein
VDQKPVRTSDILVWLGKWLFVALAGLVALWVLSLVFNPVMEQVGKSLSFLTGAVSGAKRGSFESIGMLCILGIIIVAVAKIVARRR